MKRSFDILVSMLALIVLSPVLLLTAIVGSLTNGMAEWNFGDSEIITIIWFLVGLSIAMSRTFHQTQNVI